MVKQNIFEAELVEFLFSRFGLNDTVHYSCSIFFQILSMSHVEVF